MLPNDREQVRERMAELGRASGRARRARKSRTFGVRDFVRGKWREDPGSTWNELSQTVYGMKLLTELDEEERAAAQEAEKPTEAPTRPVGFADLIALAYRTGNAKAMGLPVTPAELEELLATAEDQGSSESGSRARVTAGVDACAPTSTSDEDGVGAVGRGGSTEIDLSPVPPQTQESVVPWACPPAIYADATTQAVHRRRVKRGQPTGHPYDVYRDAAERL